MGTCCHSGCEVCISWWMCYTDLWFQAPADGLDSVSQRVCVFSVFEWLRASKWMRGAGGGGARICECFLCMFVFSGFSMCVNCSEWADLNKSHIFSTWFSEAPAAPRRSFAMRSPHWSYFSSLIPAKKHAEPLIWSLFTCIPSFSASFSPLSTADRKAFFSKSSCRHFEISKNIKSERL